MMSTQMLLKNDEQAVFALRQLYRQYGYAPYKMNRFEEYDLYVQNKDFLISDQVITFSDRNGRLLALKPDVTLSIIKNAPDTPGVVEKVYYNENVYRVDKGTHMFKEILQTGLECVGDLSTCEVAEVVLLAAKSLSLMNEAFVLDISHMGLIHAALEQSGLSETGKSCVMTCLRQKNTHELQRICNDGGCSEECTQKLTALIRCTGAPSKVLTEVREWLRSENEVKALEELTQLCGILDAQGFGDTVRIDFSVGSDMKYYSGVVFKGYLAGLPSGVLSGGQYDKLLRKMGRSSSAIGFAIYLDMLERLQQPSSGFDIDTVLLYEASADPRQVMLISEELRKTGSVLAATELPQGRTWQRLFRLERGEAVLIEDNG